MRFAKPLAHQQDWSSGRRWEEAHPETGVETKESEGQGWPGPHIWLCQRPGPAYPHRKTGTECGRGRECLGHCRGPFGDLGVAVGGVESSPGVGFLDGKGDTAEERAHPKPKAATRNHHPHSDGAEVQARHQEFLGPDVELKLGRHTEQGCRARTEQLVGMEVSCCRFLYTC